MTVLGTEKLNWNHGALVFRSVS